MTYENCAAQVEWHFSKEITKKNNVWHFCITIHSRETVVLVSAYRYRYRYRATHTNTHTVVTYWVFYLIQIKLVLSSSTSPITPCNFPLHCLPPPLHSSLSPSFLHLLPLLMIHLVHANCKNLYWQISKWISNSSKMSRMNECICICSCGCFCIFFMSLFLSHFSVIQNNNNKSRKTRVISSTDVYLILSLK